MYDDWQTSLIMLYIVLQGHWNNPLIILNIDFMKLSSLFISITICCTSKTTIAWPCSILSGGNQILIVNTVEVLIHTWYTPQNIKAILSHTRKLTSSLVNKRTPQNIIIVSSRKCEAKY